MKFLLLMALFASLPVAGLVWVRWRFRPGRMHANAERLLREIEEKMELKTDDQLIAFFREHRYLNGPVKGSAPARRVLSLVEHRQFAQLAAEWPELFSQLIEAEEVKRGERAQLIDYTLELGAAATVLARRHPA
jgi:hypothetical protein